MKEEIQYCGAFIESTQLLSFAASKIEALREAWAHSGALHEVERAWARARRPRVYLSLAVNKTRLNDQSFFKGSK